MGGTKDGLEWTWGTLKGDFNEDPTVSQIVTNMIITAIPVVDQAADIRDILAALKQLIIEKRVKEVMVLFTFVITLIDGANKVQESVASLKFSRSMELECPNRVVEFLGKCAAFDVYVCFYR